MYFYDEHSDAILLPLPVKLKCANRCIIIRTNKSSSFSVGFQGISQLGSAFIFLQ